MRVEPYALDSYVHVVKRGTRGLPIFRDESDKRRFLKILFYLNDNYQNNMWESDIADLKLPLFARPNKWPERDPLVKIICFTLMPNHFHLVLKEIQEDGMARFMQRLGNSMTGHFNKKYKERGSIFQGSYKSRTVEDDDYLKRLAVYVMVKNCFELYPKGIDAALKNFEDAWEWSAAYPFSSLGAYLKKLESPIIDDDILAESFGGAGDFKIFAKEVIESRMWETNETLQGIILE